MDGYKIIKKGRCNEIVKVETKETKPTEQSQSKQLQLYKPRSKSPPKTSSPQKNALSPSQMDIANQHVIGSFALEFDRSREDRVEITATVQEPTPPSKKPLAPEEDKLHELYICDTEGKLLGKIPFLESEYREALIEALEESRLSEQDKP
ncbi:hypothetical protein KR074_002537 [Drosophila pseudoananassae]|nr:hypothetical protein KR074_002537 [Drosophila pseudoananassae]